MRIFLALCLLTLALPALANEPITRDGRTWTWNTGLGMYQPSGSGWNYDADRETWWRPKAAPVVVKAVHLPRPAGEGWTWHAEGYWYRYVATASPASYAAPMINCGPRG